MIYIHNSKKEVPKTTKIPTQNPIPLSQRGVRQAQRNQSDEIWSMMNWCSQTQSSQYVCYYCGTLRCNQCVTQKSSRNQYSKTMAETSKNEEQPPKQFERSKISTINQQASNQEFSGTKDKKMSKSRSQGKNKSVSFKDQIKQNELSQGQRMKIHDRPEDYERYQRQCYSIQKYLQNTKAYTRTMPNSAIRLFYEKPCLQSYGRKNTSGNNGFIYNDYLKTHNVQPHRHDNDPKKYQTYRSALNFGKRAKLDPEERMKRIHRQFSKKLDMKALVDDFSIGYVPVTSGNLDETLKYNIDHMKKQNLPERRSKSTDNLRRYDRSLNLGSTADTTIKLASEEERETEISKLQERKKKSKSYGKKEYLFLYRYQDEDGDVQYAKDRHGITCYADPTFQQNDKAYLKFLRKIKPIEAEDVRPEDKNIDKIMVDNYIKSQKEDIPQHYLIPNCDEPYRPEKYSIKSRKKSLGSTTGTNYSEKPTVA